VRIEVSAKQRSLEEDQARDPDRGRAAENGDQLFCRDWLNEKEQESAEKYRGCEQTTRSRHANL
jgi:hypothetical protein